MSSLETYISSLPGMTEEELVTEARSATSLLSRARKSGTKKSVANLERMQKAIASEKAARGGVQENPGESIADSYAGKVARMTDRTLRAENKKMKNMLRDSAAPVRHFGTEGLSLLKQMIATTEREMRGRNLTPNPCRPMKNPTRLAYRKTEPYDVILYKYEDGTWFFEIRDPGLGGDLVYDDHDGRSRAAAEEEALRVIAKELDGDQGNPKKKKPRKRGVSSAGRGAIGAGIGALALGPIGAVGLGYAATKYKPTKAKENPKRRSRKNPSEKFKVHVTGAYYSAETGTQPMRKTIVIEAKTQDEARKKAASQMGEKAQGMGYEFSGEHRKFKAEKMNPTKRATKKTAKKAVKKVAKKAVKKTEVLISKSRKLWDSYVAKPGRKTLKAVFSHLRKMEKSSEKTIKAEWRRAKRVAKSEAKRLKMKV